MEIVKILLIAIGGYGANYMKELTEKMSQTRKSKEFVK